MAALDNGQKQAMALTPSFQARLKFAVVENSKYWNELATPNVGDYNLEMQKKKRFAKFVLNGGSLDMQNYATVFLANYEDANPSLITDGPYNGQLTDDVLNDSATSVQTFKWAAGVETGDDTKKLNGKLILTI